MRKLVAFEQISLDGRFVDAAGYMSWAHKQDPEWNRFSAENAGGGGALVFGRVTYEMMAAFWPTSAAKDRMPEVAAGMNAMAKFVFSRSIREASWENTTILRGDVEAETRKLKATPGPDLVILGSGRLVAALTKSRLVDVFQLVVNPVVVGGGRTLFEGLDSKVPLRRTGARLFGNGNVVLTYEPAA